MRRHGFGRRASLERLVIAQRMPLGPISQVCASCQKHLGGVTPDTPGCRLSHGLCGPCKDTALEEGRKEGIL